MWLHLKPHSSLPLEIYSQALKRNKNITLIAFKGSDSVIDLFEGTILNLPWVTFIFIDYFTIRVKSMLSRDYPLFIKSKNNDLITFAKEIGPPFQHISHGRSG
jgi:hypothetical protein